MGPADVWNELASPWQAAFDEAWASWSAGCFGIGAVAVDEAGEIVARGRNRVLEQKSAPGVLADTAIAHAEMNVLAGVPWQGASGVELYTTLEPCLMCASAIRMAPIGIVHFAAADAMFAGLTDVLAMHPFAAQRAPRQHGPIGGPLQRFASVLPLSFIAFWVGAEGDSIRFAQDHDPATAALALDLVRDGRLVVAKDAGGSTVDALTAIWDDLV